MRRRLETLALLAATVGTALAVAADRMEFEVASVKQATGAFVPPTFPLDNGDAFTPTGGRFFAQFPLLVYIQFAWKIRPTPQETQTILASVPKWVSTDRFEIEARAAGNPTKDQMRLMMQSLLADRFHLVLHFESRETAVFALKLIKPGVTGPKPRLHSEGPACDAAPADRAVTFPAQCDVQSLLLKPGRMAQAVSRNSTLDLLANSLSGLGALERPVIDQTGLTGKYDYAIEWFDEAGAFTRPPGPNSPNAAPGPPGPGFLEALHDQLGLKLESTKAPIQFLIIDKVERPSEN